METFRWMLQGRFAEADVEVEWTPSTRRIVPRVEAAIEAAWQRTLARPHVHLFDGEVCRLESFAQRTEPQTTLCLKVSRTRYRIVVGTNFEHPEFLDQHGPDVMANPLGVSAGVISSDGFLILGRRNARVAYYPQRVHPFAGSLEVRERINLFDDVRRELREEIGCGRSDIQSLVMVGLVEDALLRHPESLFLARLNRTRQEIEAQVKDEEHGGSVAIDLRHARPADSELLAQMTPVCQAVHAVAREDARADG